MNGFEVLAGALLNAGDRFYTVPGYPITELGAMIEAESVVGEKVALEYAIGDSLVGKRAAVIMKNVGLNSCADPLIEATSQGIIGGIVIIAGDDPGAEGSTNTQDSRYYGELGQLPVLEPGPSSCAESVEAAFSASEQFSRIALIRVTPELLYAPASQKNIRKNPGKGSLAPPGLTMKGRAARADVLLAAMFAWSENHKLNRFFGGIMGVGAVQADSELVMVYPPPERIRSYKEIREIGRPFVQEHRNVEPPSIPGEPETIEARGYCRTFCPGCPFLTVIDILKIRKMTVVADAGCSILTLNPPYRLGIANYGLGTAIGVAAKSTGVALIGDYALVHSGIQSLIDVYEKNIPLLCIVLNNRCMGMTG
jgi:indolepyruvate ferredoxin oxidoreductase alpha subunit